MLDKTFDAKTEEPRIYAQWEDSGQFAPKNDDGSETFSIVIPPPNVTGSLHVGHALNNTLQDVLARFERLRGKAVLWLPGTDHAGIATQMVVERQLAQAGNGGRREMGREAFVSKVWEWKAQSGGTIVQQLRRLGASCDWTRERFTLDDGLSAAVRKVFVDLYRKGLIYRDKRLVNWDPHFQTAISDLEVEQREVDGAFYHFAYPLADGLSYDHQAKTEDGTKILETQKYIVVATTRPETLLGDTAVAVHPDDPRYAGLVGNDVILPLTGRRIPIIADSYADPEKGSGAVKITPAHDFNDFQVGKRHGLATINILTETATLNASAPPELAGLDRFAARKQILARAEAEGWLIKVEKTRHMVPHGDRSGVVIEPFLTDQWYVNAGELAQEAIKAVEDGRTVFEPRNWEKTYFEWMRNIEPWCISRQLWWGHRIPAWYGPDGQIFVGIDQAEVQAQADIAYGHSVTLKQDEDVLDTWFSSALWPFSTLGWPESTVDMARFYPTHTLITGFDIIFFWVARMMMMGLHFTHQVPFKRVFINALVRDENGAKMSKSKGNVMDPLELIDDFGADALRFTLTAMSGQGRDIKLSRARIEGYRNFGTKLWNAMRFAEINDCTYTEGYNPSESNLALSRWIYGETQKVSKSVATALEACAFDQAANLLYRFVWNTVCDWCLELAKPILNGTDEAAKTEIRASIGWVMRQCLILLHPVMPFVTESLWAQTGGTGLLMGAQWPVYADAQDHQGAFEINMLIDLVSQIRSVRSEMNVPLSARPVLNLVGDGTDQSDVVRRIIQDPKNRDQLARLAFLNIDITYYDVDSPEVVRGAVPIVLLGAVAHLKVMEFIDVRAEVTRLGKEISAHEKTKIQTEAKLNNPDFLSRAPEDVIDENRQRLSEALSALVKLGAALKRMEDSL